MAELSGVVQPWDFCIRFTANGMRGGRRYRERFALHWYDRSSYLQAQIALDHPVDSERIYAKRSRAQRTLANRHEARFKGVCTVPIHQIYFERLDFSNRAHERTSFIRSRS